MSPYQCNWVRIRTGWQLAEQPEPEPQAAAKKPKNKSGKINGLNMFKASSIVAFAPRRQFARFWTAWTGSDSDGKPWPDSFADEASEKLLTSFIQGSSKRPLSPAAALVLAGPPAYKSALMESVRDMLTKKLKRIRCPERDVGGHISSEPRLHTLHATILNTMHVPAYSA